jgi:hypothetical protein
MFRFVPRQCETVPLPIQSTIAGGSKCGSNGQAAKLNCASFSDAYWSDRSFHISSINTFRPRREVFQSTPENPTKRGFLAKPGDFGAGRLSTRKTNLEPLLRGRPDVNPFETGVIGPDLFHAACSMGLEGLVSKRGGSPAWTARTGRVVVVRLRQYPRR